MFEPIHGSAPKHAGQDKANPIATVLALRMLLDWLGRRHDDRRLIDAGTMVEDAVARVLAAGQALTYDLASGGRGVSCSVCGDAITGELLQVRQRS
jgi:3-isopropylmalate dehydrogenase